MCPIEFNEHRDEHTKTDMQLEQSENLVVNESESLQKKLAELHELNNKIYELNNKKNQTQADLIELQSLKIEKEIINSEVRVVRSEIEGRQVQEKECIDKYDSNYGEQLDENRKQIDSQLNGHLAYEESLTTKDKRTPEEEKELKRRQQEVINKIADYILLHNPEVKNNPREARRLAEIIFYEKAGYTDHERSLLMLDTIELQLQNGFTEEALKNLGIVQSNSAIDPNKSREEYEQERKQLRQNFSDFALKNPSLAKQINANLQKDLQIEQQKLQERQLGIASYLINAEAKNLTPATKKNLTQAAEASGGADIIAKALAGNTVYERDGVVTIPFDEQTDITIDQRGTMRVGKVTVSSLEPNVFDQAYIQNLAENQQLNVGGIPDSEQLFTQLLRVNTADINRITAKEGEVVIALLKALDLQKESTSEVSSVFKELGIVNANNKLDPVKTHLLRTYLVQTTNLDPQKIKDNVSREAIKTFMALPTNTNTAIV